MNKISIYILVAVVLISINGFANNPSCPQFFSDGEVYRDGPICTIDSKDYYSADLTKYYPDTSLWGVDSPMLDVVRSKVTGVLHGQLRKNVVLGIYIIGTRVQGGTHHGKALGPKSPLYILVHIKDIMGFEAADGTDIEVNSKILTLLSRMRRKLDGDLERVLPFNTKIHFTHSSGDVPFDTVLTTHHTGRETGFGIHKSGEFNPDGALLSSPKAIKIN